MLVGDNTGLAILGSLTPVVGYQMNVLVLPVMFGIKLFPVQILVSNLIPKLGDTTVTVKNLVVLHVPRDALSVYVVVVVGERVGVAILVLLTPTDGLQLYTVALLIVLATIESPLQMLELELVNMVKLLFKIIDALYVDIQELASVIVAV